PRPARAGRRVLRPRGHRGSLARRSSGRSGPWVRGRCPAVRPCNLPAATGIQPPARSPWGAANAIVAKGETVMRPESGASLLQAEATSARPSPRGAWPRRIPWAAQVVVALILAQTLFFKFTYAPETRV